MNDDRIPRATMLFPRLVTVHFDGACQPPRSGGTAAYGFTISGEGLDREESGLAVPPGSERATNNVAEYTAAIRALEYLRDRGYDGAVLLVGDSQLVVRQMEGEYEVRAEHLRAYHQRLAALSKEFEEVRFLWVPRDENRRADELSKEAIERVRPVSSSR
ncbi:MAG: ribonuclease HI family protein [Thermoplasmata archaeon]|nr:ribonuclease HI family protein [Thermoplasmata archaeon]MCI4359318.1 ribonuclease HI family protein [Thermoplasmata archaeon]